MPRTFAGKAGTTDSGKLAGGRPFAAARSAAARNGLPLRYSSEIEEVADDAVGEP